MLRCPDNLARLGHFVLRCRGRARRRIALSVVLLPWLLVSLPLPPDLGPQGDLSLPSALALMPDTPEIRAAGVWYADYALAERVYGVEGVKSMTDTRISRFLGAIVALHPGPETGVSSLALGRWQQVYGYDLFSLSAEIYTTGGGAPSHDLGVVTGQLDPSYIAHQLATTGYTPTLVGPDRLFIRWPLPPGSMPGHAMNVISLPGHLLVAGAWTTDVLTATTRLRQGSGLLAGDAQVRLLAAALGTVQGAFLAQHNAESPGIGLSVPGLHKGARLHQFAFYATAYQEPRPGQRFMEIALAYARRADALADAATLRTRLAQEMLPIYGAPWRRLVAVSSVSAQGSNLVIRLRLRPTTSPLLWQDVVVEGGLSILTP